MTEATSSKKFGAFIYENARVRSETEEGKEEMKGQNLEHFLATLKVFTDAIDTLPETYTLHSLYLALNYVGSVVVTTVEANKRKLMRETGGHA